MIDIGPRPQRRAYQGLGQQICMRFKIGIYKKGNVELKALYMRF